MIQNLFFKLLQIEKNRGSFFKGFTLIELLVTVAVIGLLSSIVLVSLQGAKDQADVSKAQEFSHVVRVSLGAGLIGEWRFDDGTATDSSGSGNEGVLNGTVSVDGMIRKAMEFDAKSDYIELQSGIDSTIITAEMWYYYNGNGGSWNTLFCRDGGTYHHLLIESATQEIGFYNAGWRSSGYSLIQSNWYHLVLVKNGNNSKIYVNGELRQDRADSFDNAVNPLKVIGNHGGHSQGSLGIIDEVRVYDQALSTSEIQQLYAQGAVKHNIVLK